ncbi:MAG: phosphate ABC transporter substrate-binding protein [Sandaracinus sp.]
MRSLLTLTVLATLASVGLLACSGGHGREPDPTATSESPGTEPSAAQPARGGTLSVKGSDTMVILAQRWAEGFMASHEGAQIQVSGGGSGTGISALLAGTADVANASRPMNERERTTLSTDRHAEAHETRVALDALAIYVHRDNPVTSLTMEQLASIYRGQVTNWSAVGGPDRPIVLYSRENNSGTYAYFKEHVLANADFAITAQTLPGTAAVINAVSQDVGGIGYGGIGYAQGIRTVPIAGADGTPIEPTLENATSGRYPLSRFLFMYTAGAPSGLAADFLSFVTSEDGQRLVEQAGFYPLPREGAAPAPGAPPATAPAAPVAPGGAEPAAAQPAATEPGATAPTAPSEAAAAPQ